MQFQVTATGESQRIRVRAVNIALVATFLLCVAKVSVAFFSGSISVLSEAIHSGLDLLSSVLTRLVVAVSLKPADPGRPFGYGKLENISALFEAFLLMAAGVYIVYEGVQSLHHGAALKNLDWAMVVTVVSMVVNMAVYLQNRHVGRLEESIAIETNALHFLADFFTSAALLVGLVVIHFTQWTFIDPLAAVALAIYIFAVAVAQIRKCIAELSDVALPQDEVAQIEALVKSQGQEFLNFHDLRTRRMGKWRHVEMHLTVCSEFKVKEAHDICDRIEDSIKHRFPDSHVTIHIEPCDHHSGTCEQVCPTPCGARGGPCP